MQLSRLLGVILGLLTIVITLAIAPSIAAANSALLPSSQVDVFAGVVTGPAATTTNQTLSENLYHDSVSYVSSIVKSSSNKTDAGPFVAAVYYPTSQNLYITGLDAAGTRTLTVTYQTGLDLTDLIGIEVVGGFGAPLAILGLLAMSGLFAIGSWKGSANMRDMLGVILTAIIVIVGLTFMVNIIDYSNDLVDAGTSSIETVLYGLIPLIVYLAVIGLAGFGVYRGAKGMRKGNTKSYTGGY